MEPTPGPSSNPPEPLISSASGDNEEIKKEKQKLANKFFEESKSILGFVKHGILTYYFKGWLPILCRNQYRGYSKLVYVDGFAGAGVYAPDRQINCQDDKFGSATLVYEAALKHTNLPDYNKCPKVYLIFIEKDKDNCKKLLENLLKIRENALNDANTKVTNLAKVNVIVINGEFAKTMEWILSNSFDFPENIRDIIQPPAEIKLSNPQVDDDEYIESFITPQTPLFVFVDPFGFNGMHMPMPLMRRILLSSTKAEILLNLMTGNIRRFCGLDNRTRPLNLLFGETETDATWKERILGADTNDRVEMILKYYYECITSGNDNILKCHIAIRDKRNVLIYHLYHFCQHQLGKNKMKYAMNRFSQSERDYTFSGFKDCDPSFEKEIFTLQEIKAMIVSKFKDSGQEIVTGKEVIEFLERTPTIAQPQKVPLKKALNNYKVNSENCFEKINFNFNKIQTPEVDCAGDEPKKANQPSPKKKPKISKDSPSKIKTQTKQKESNKNLPKITSFFPRTPPKNQPK